MPCVLLLPVTIAAFTHVFAMTEGLLPPTPKVVALFRIFTLEKGLLLGLGLFLTGLLFLGRAFFFWKNVQFGALSYPESLRLVIPSITLLVLGGEVIFSSFFLSILGLQRK